MVRAPAVGTANCAQHADVRVGVAQNLVVEVGSPEQSPISSPALSALTSPPVVRDRRAPCPQPSLSL